MAPTSQNVFSACVKQLDQLPPKEVAQVVGKLVTYRDAVLSNEQPPKKDPPKAAAKPPAKSSAAAAKSPAAAAKSPAKSSAPPAKRQKSGPLAPNTIIDMGTGPYAAKPLRIKSFDAINKTYVLEEEGPPGRFTELKGSYPKHAAWTVVG